MSVVAAGVEQLWHYTCSCAAVVCVALVVFVESGLSPGVARFGLVKSASRFARSRAVLVSGLFRALSRAIDMNFVV